MKQYSLFKTENTNVHGGDLAIGKRKRRRPLSTRKPIHVVLKAKIRLYPHRQFLAAQTNRYGEKFGVRIYDIAIGPDHIHLALVIHHRDAYKAFVRSLTAKVARIFGKGIWTLLPFTRVAAWGKAYEELKKYFQKNRDEAAGLRAYEPRRDWYKKLRPKP